MTASPAGAYQPLLFSTAKSMDFYSGTDTFFAAGNKRSAGLSPVWQTGPVWHSVPGPGTGPVGATASGGPVALERAGCCDPTRLQRACGLARSTPGRDLSAAAAQLVR